MVGRYNHEGKGGLPQALLRLDSSLRMLTASKRNLPKNGSSFSRAWQLHIGSTCGQQMHLGRSKRASWWFGNDNPGLIKDPPSPLEGQTKGFGNHPKSKKVGSPPQNKVKWYDDMGKILDDVGGLWICFYGI